jgi:hypothetical protein
MHAYREGGEPGRRKISITQPTPTRSRCLIAIAPVCCELCTATRAFTSLYASRCDGGLFVDDQPSHRKPYIRAPFNLGLVLAAAGSPESPPLQLAFSQASPCVTASMQAISESTFCSLCGVVIEAHDGTLVDEHDRLLWNFEVRASKLTTTSHLCTHPCELDHPTHLSCRSYYRAGRGRVPGRGRIAKTERQGRTSIVQRTSGMWKSSPDFSLTLPSYITVSSPGRQKRHVADMIYSPDHPFRPKAICHGTWVPELWPRGHRRPSRRRMPQSLRRQSRGP